MSLPLKIGILAFTATRKRASRAELMLKRAAVARGHKARIFFTKHFHFVFNTNFLGLLYRHSVFPPPDVMIIRPSIVSDIDLQLSIVKQLQLMGVPVVNHYLPIARAKNKIRTVQILSHQNLPIPKTVVAHNIENIDRAIDELGSFPLIMKLAQGLGGNGVSILESRRSLRSMVDLITVSDFAKNNHILIQEYIREAKGKDIRVFVVGGKIIAAMERKAKRGEFRANFHQGGSVALTDLTDEEKSLALKAVAVIGLDIAGVDIIRTGEGPKILEVNANPGLDGITLATGINVADHIIQYAAKVVRRKRWLIEKETVATAA